MSVECRLSEILKDKDMSVSDLSANTGLSRTTITYLRDGKSQGIQYETLEIICEYLDITPNQLLVICTPKQDERRELTKLYIQQRELEIELLKKLI